MDKNFVYIKKLYELPNIYNIYENENQTNISYWFGFSQYNCSKSNWTLVPRLNPLFYHDFDKSELFHRSPPIYTYIRQSVHHVQNQWIFVCRHHRYNI